MFSSIMDGMNDALADDAVGTGKLSAKYKGSGVRNGVNMNTVLGLAELCWGGGGALTLPRQGLGNAAISAVASDEQLERFGNSWAAMALGVARASLEPP